MNSRNLTWFFLVLFGLAGVSSAQAGVRKGARIRLPKKLVCVYQGDEPGEPVTLYTRLEKITRLAQLPPEGKSLEVWGDGSPDSSKPKPDEVAYDWRGDYYAASINRDEYRYSVWTCDTEDRDYVFETKRIVELGRKAPAERKVPGKVTISVREDEETHALDCTAYY